MIRIKIDPERLNDVDDRLFGQFLERASFGEPGPEAVADPVTGDLPAAAVKLMREMKIPVVRFPGGTDIDYIDWRDLISNVPGRSAQRPVTVGHKGDEITNAFGLDEYFRLRDELGFQTILIGNLLDAVGKSKPLEQAALLAAGLVAYANARQGAKLPEGMPDWPGVRAANGHPEPYGAEYFQIGNEWNFFVLKAMERSGITDPRALATWYREVVLTYIALIREVDSDIKIIVDAHSASNSGTGEQRDIIEGEIERLLFADSEFRSGIDFAAIHAYSPGPMDKITRDGEAVPHAQLSREDWWYTWVAMPGHYSAAGESLGLGDRSDPVRVHGIPVVCTEWNWNGWRYNEIAPNPGIGCELAAGLGAAGFLQGLMRDGDTVVLACQSMLLGCNWGITAIRVDPKGGAEPHYRPQGHVTMLYANHHGTHRIGLQARDIPTIEQPYTLTNSPPRPVLALVDAIATADESTIYVHLINRHISENYGIEIDLSELPGTTGSGNKAPAITGGDGPAVHHTLTGDLKPRKPGESEQMTRITIQSAPARGGKVRVTLPPHSVNIVEITRR